MDRELLWYTTRRLIYVGVCALVILFHTLPLPGNAMRWPPPDIIMAVSFVWTLRRPEVISPLMVGAMVLLADLLLMRPPGLWALLVVLGCVYLNIRQKDLSQAMFGLDWAYAGGVTVAVFAAYFVLQFPLFLPAMSAGTLALQALFTILIYPAVAFVSVRVFGISKVRKIEDV